MIVRVAPDLLDEAGEQSPRRWPPGLVRRGWPAPRRWPPPSPVPSPAEGERIDQHADRDQRRQRQRDGRRLESSAGDCEGTDSAMAADHRGKARRVKGAGRPHRAVSQRPGLSQRPCSEIRRKCRPRRWRPGVTLLDCRSGRGRALLPPERGGNRLPGSCVRVSAAYKIAIVGSGPAGLSAAGPRGAARPVARPAREDRPSLRHDLQISEGQARHGDAEPARAALGHAISTPASARRSSAPGTSRPRSTRSTSGSMPR